MGKFPKPINSNAIRHYYNPLDDIPSLLWGPKLQCRPDMSPPLILLLGHINLIHTQTPYDTPNWTKTHYHYIFLCSAPELNVTEMTSAHFGSGMGMTMGARRANTTCAVQSTLRLDSLYDHRKMTTCWRKVGVYLQAYSVPVISRNIYRESLQSHRPHHQ